MIRFLWNKFGKVFVNESVCIFSRGPSVNVDDEKMAGKQGAKPNMLVKPTRNVEFEDPTPTYLLNKCDGAALSVKCSPMIDLLWRTTYGCSQNSSPPVRMSKLNDECE